MLNQNIRNKTLWSFNCVYQQNVFTNHIFNIQVKIGFGNKLPTMVDITENQTKPNLVRFFSRTRSVTIPVCVLVSW